MFELGLLELIMQRFYSQVMGGFGSRGVWALRICNKKREFGYQEEALPNP